MTDTTNIYAHIVGFNNKDKEEFIKDVKSLDFDVLDLNYVTKKVRENDFYKDVKIEREKTKSKFEKNAYDKCLYNYWKKKVGGSLLNMKNKKIILIGMNSFDNNKMEIKANHKFFIKHNLESNAKEIVKENLEKYHDKILDGSFSFDYIDKEFLMKKRQESMESFKKDNYNVITYPNLLKFLNQGSEVLQSNQKADGEHTKTNLNEHPSVLYYASALKYDGQIGSNGKKKRSQDALDAMLDVNREIIAYKYKWLALLSYIPDHQKYFEKGFRNDKPYIHIINKEGKKLLNDTCYLYEISSKNFIKASDKNPYKFRSNFAEIKSNEYIANIYEELKNLKIPIN